MSSMFPPESSPHPVDEQSKAQQPQTTGSASVSTPNATKPAAVENNNTRSQSLLELVNND
ncbi:unnamed protein product [Ceratitis capitata]|uniref:(Mediterranean fruit fly) hypothetical protein n=1 Tax=Ceratitis capitata TaxID=7213 RepID=A0A811UTB0_CERCA|nr:unnamed protein product [Ceratitis capitata]